MTLSDRDARIAEIADDIRIVNRALSFLKSAVEMGERWSGDWQDVYDKAGDAMHRIDDYSRTALAREAEATKDAERLDGALKDALQLIDAASPTAWHNGNTHNGIDEGDVLTGRFLESIRSRAVSLSENVE